MTEQRARGGSSSLFRDGNALRWVVGFTMSLVADQVWFVALAWAAVQVGTPAQVGLVLAAGAVPRAVLLLLGGAVADRWGPRRAAVLSDIARTGILLGAVVVAVDGTVAVPALVVVAVLFGAVDAVFLPASSAMPAQLVAPEQMTQLSAIRQFALRFSIIVGAPLGGLLVASRGAGTAWAVAAVGTAVSVLALLATRVRAAAPTESAERERGVLSDVGEGVRYAVGHKMLLPLLMMAAVSEFGFGGALNTGVPLLSEERGWGAGGIGTLLSAFGVGAATSALLLVLTRRVPAAGRWFGPIALVGATSLAGIGVSTSLWTATLASVVLGVAAGLQGSLFASLVLTHTSAGLVGRVFSLVTMSALGLAPVSLAMAGAIVGAAGVTAPFLFGAGFVLLSIAPALAPAVRHAELPKTS